MKKGWVVAIVIALVVGVVGLSGCGCGRVTPVELPSGLNLNVTSQQQGIWVSGDGEITVTPDIANLRLGISAQKVTVDGAQAQAAEAMDKVMTALADNGVSDKDIQTQRFSIQQITRWDDVKGEEVVVGYRVTNMVMAKIRDIDNAGTIIDAVAKAGGDLTRIDNISLSVDDPSAYHKEAREKALADAKAKAKQLAELAGVSLGKPIYISESLYAPPIIYPSAVYKEAAPVPAPAPPTVISPGEMEISLTVQVVYAISD